MGRGVPQSVQWTEFVYGGDTRVLRPTLSNITLPAESHLEQDDTEYFHDGSKSLDWVVEQLRGSQFYRWEFGENYQAHNRYASENPGRCCAVHSIGLPLNKPGLPQGLFPYEKTVYDALQEHDDLWIKKATGLGISEFFLYYFLWVACKDNSLQGTHIGFITGPRMEITVMLMDRLKNLPILRDVQFSFRKEVFKINGVHFEAYPSNNLHSARGIDRVSYWFLDEADFWDTSQQNEARTVAERYWGKSQARVIMVSTPNVPNGLFDRMEHEEYTKYHRIFLHYTLGVNYIYTEEDIAKAKASPSFDREFGLQYLGQEGDVFDMRQLAYAVDVLGPTVNYVNPSPIDLKSMGIDPGYAKSKYGIVITNYNHKTGKIEIIYAEEFAKQPTSQITKRAYDLAEHFHVSQLLVDASQNGQIRDLKVAYKEPVDYEEHIADCKKNKIPIAQAMKVVPVSFGPPVGDEMITKCQDLLDNKMIAIPEVFRDLIAQLRTATKDITGKLDKKTYGTMDLFDAFRAAMWYYNPYRARTIVRRRDRDSSTVQTARIQNSNAIWGLRR